MVPLLNGLEHMTALRDRFPGRTAAGVIRIESDRPAPGVIIQTSPFLRIDLASDDPRLGPSLGAFADTLRDAGVPVQLGPSESQIVWSKLVRLDACLHHQRLRLPDRLHPHTPGLAGGPGGLYQRDSPP